MSSFLNASIFSLLYFLFRFFEMRVVLKENKPLKTLLRDSLLVYLSVISGEFLIEQLSPLADGISTQPNVFINDPEF